MEPEIEEYPRQDSLEANRSVRDQGLFPFVLVPKTFLIKHDPSLIVLGTYISLKFYANVDAAECQNISVATLARRVNISKDSIERGLTQLEKMGLIKIIHRYRKGPNGKNVPLPNRYEILEIK